MDYIAGGTIFINHPEFIFDIIGIAISDAQFKTDLLRVRNALRENYPIQRQ